MRPTYWLSLAAILSLVGCNSAKEVVLADTQDMKPPEGYNRLYFETSPYLKLHEKNPVDWYPWGDEAFKKAREEDKLVFLSIGYSTCHWCHVMEEESFADQDVADALKAGYISVKVDREQMPDIDHVYMQVTQAMTGRGGWPNTLLLTPDKKPVFAATYIPKEPLINLLTEGSRVWEEERDALLEQGETVTTAIQAYLARTNSGKVTDGSIHIAASDLMQSYDEVNGGFSDKPKFPTPMNLVFMLRAAERTGDETYKDAALETLTKMRHGGIYDQVGFGFHRYSVDEKWRVPHFEKMLYDQATHVLAYTEAYHATGQEIYKRTAEEILTYVSQEMSDKEGGFWSAQDADSEGEEGKFYVWSEDKLKDALTDEEFVKAKIWFQTTAEGNFIDEATGGLTGKNVLELKPGTPDSEEFAAIRKKLFSARSKRIPPLTDDKIMTDWNGLMIAAYARAGVVFDEPKWTERAQKSAAFIKSTMLLDSGTLAHSYRGGKTQDDGFLSDYSNMVWGLTELYQATFDTSYLELAAKLAERIKADFHDKENGGFFLTTTDHEAPLGRAKQMLDGALPSSNAIAAYSLVRLGRILARKEFEDLGNGAVEAYGGDIESGPSAFLGLLLTTDFLAGPSSEVVIVGPRKEALAMMRQMQKVYSPRSVFVLKDEDDKQLGAIAEYTKPLEAINGKPTAYVCQGYTCQLPTTELSQALANLKTATSR